VDVRIISETHTQVPVVPYDALIPNGDGYAVFVYAAGHVRKVAVTLGITTDTVVEITRGVKPGERIVVNPPSNLQDGEAVTPV
jgi:HlyD family secretion protein